MKNYKPIDFLNDFRSSLIQSAVIIPSVIGIALISGFSPIFGLVSSIIAMFITCIYSKCPYLSVGPAIAFSTLCYDMLEQFGVVIYGAIFLAASILQFLIGYYKKIEWFKILSPSIAIGFLSAIGFNIIISEVLAIFDIPSKGNTLANISTIFSMISELPSLLTQSKYFASFTMTVVGLLTLITFKKIPIGKFFPAELIVIVVGGFIAHFLSLPVNFLNQYGEISSQIFNNNGGLLEYLGNNILVFGNIDYTKLSVAPILVAIAALTSMFVLVYIFNTTSYVNVMKSSSIDLSHEFKTIGLTNIVLALFRALPVAPCVAGPNVTIGSGMKSKMAVFLVGIWMSSIVIFFPNILQFIPNPIIYSIFLYYGFTILNIPEVKNIARYGKSEIFIWAFTFISMVSLGFIFGFLASLIAPLIKIIWKFCMSFQIDNLKDKDQKMTITMSGAATFLRLPLLSHYLKEAAQEKNIFIDINNLFYIDHSCLYCLIDWEKSLNRQQKMTVDWNHLALIYDTLPSEIFIDEKYKFVLKRKKEMVVDKENRKKGISIEYIRGKSDENKNKK